MKYNSICVILAILGFTSCASHVALSQDKHEQSVAVRELREEIADLKHALNNTQVELQILEDQYKDQPSSPKQIPSSSSNQDQKISLLEKKISQLSTHATQTSLFLNESNAKIAELEKSVDQQKALLTEIVQLKSSLSKLTSSLQKESIEEISYKVKAGDSLEKIARLYKVSVLALKEENNLSNNKIIIGQELKIPAGTSP